jgi:hypothetical protein
MEFEVMLAIGIIGILVLALFMVLVIFLIKRAKGKMEIQLDDYNFSPGKVITGRIYLKLKKPQEGILKVGLTGTYRRRSYGKEKNTNRNMNAYFIEIPITNMANFNLGESWHEFQFQVPGDVTNTLNSGAIGGAIKTAQFLMSGTVTNIDWYFTARLDVKGIDLTKKVKVSVANLPMNNPGVMY